MISIENVLSEWQKDSVINQSKLDESSVDTAKLHAKYLQWLSLSKLQLKKSQMNQKTLLKEKWLYYNGKMSQEEIESKGWVFGNILRIGPYIGSKSRFNPVQI